MTGHACSSKNWTRENLAWLAGIIEGEGCLMARRHKGRVNVRVQVAMTDRDVLEKCHAISGCGTVRAKGKFGSTPAHWKPQYVWSVHRHDCAYALIVAIYPWLMARRKAKARECVAMYKGLAKPVTHGTRYQYGKGCRCDECRAAATESVRQYRDRHPERAKQRRREWYAKNRERAIAIVNKSYAKRREEILARRRQRYHAQREMRRHVA